MLPIPGRTDGPLLAGGPLRFDRAQVLARAGTEPCRAVTSSLAELRGWAARTGTTAVLDKVLDRLTAARLPIAGTPLDRPRLMGVVNVTPDSFFDGGRYASADRAVQLGGRLAEEGADFLDIGGESTRPGADPVDEAEERRRVLPVIAGLHDRRPLSIDTRKAGIMRVAVAAGARIINDVSALAFDPHSLPTAAALGVPIVLMHAQGDPRTMQKDPRYDNVVLDVFDYLAERVAACEAAGIPRAHLVVDPGIGFGKTDAHNLALHRCIALFHGLGCAVLVGASRKATIGRLAGGAAADDRLPGSLAIAVWLATQGVQVIRIHDVAATRQALIVARAVADAVF
ncbi:MAG: dihydropteroate synthase [Alphaproteobacteria bacterium]|nr:dihydropteroate synthase [Alphaproteobacteria bacterium]